jgi:Na+/pantothenate symporter
VRYAIGVAFIFLAIIGCAGLIIGLSMRVMFPHLPSADQTSTIMALDVLSPLAGSLFLVGMLSAITSVTNAILLVLAACISHDIYGQLLNPEATEKGKLRLNRICIVLLGLVPVWFALQNYSDVQSVVVESARFMASSFFIPTIIGLNSKRGSALGATSAMFGGFAGCLLWSVFGQQGLGIDPVEVGIVASALLYFLVARFTPAVPEENLDIFFRVSPPEQA